MRVERHDLRLSWQVSCTILDVPEGRGAHVTKPLGQDQVRIRGAKGKDVDLVKGARRSEPFPDHAARLAARLALVLEERAAHNAFRARRGRVVTLRRDADEVLTEAERVADLCGRGEKGDNPHALGGWIHRRALKALFNG